MSSGTPEHTVVVSEAPHQHRPGPRAPLPGWGWARLTAPSHGPVVVTEKAEFILFFVSLKPNPQLYTQEEHVPTQQDGHAAPPLAAGRRANGSGGPLYHRPGPPGKPPEGGPKGKGERWKPRLLLLPPCRARRERNQLLLMFAS